jgi:hypothetical protein
MEALEIEIIEGNTTADDSADDMIIIENDSPPSTIPMNKSQDEFDDDLDRANADMQGLLSSNGNNRNNNKSTKRFQTKRVTRRPNAMGILSFFVLAYLKRRGGESWARTGLDHLAVPPLYCRHHHILFDTVWPGLVPLRLVSVPCLPS